MRDDRSLNGGACGFNHYRCCSGSRCKTAPREYSGGHGSLNISGDDIWKTGHSPGSQPPRRAPGLPITFLACWLCCLGRAWAQPVVRGPTGEYGVICAGRGLGVASGERRSLGSMSGLSCPSMHCFPASQHKAATLVNWQPWLSLGGWSQRREPILSWRND